MADGPGMALQRGGVRLLRLSPACTGLDWCRLMKSLFQSWSRKPMSQSTLESTPGMITHYGLFWSERDVFWGRQNKEGKMEGTEPKGDRVDYRDYVGLYCLYGSGKLLYIGQAGIRKRNNKERSGNDSQSKSNKSNIFKRLKEHRNPKSSDSVVGCWDQFSWFGCKREHLKEHAKIKDAIILLEAITIAITNPGFNRQSGSFKNAKQVFQAPHDEAVGTLETQISNLRESIIDMANQQANILKENKRS